MFKVIAVMALGVIVGRTLKSKNIGFMGKAISVLIWLLLFLLGVSVGANGEIMGSLDTIGVSAIILSLFAVLGSVIAAWVVYKYIFKKNHIK